MSIGSYSDIIWVIPMIQIRSAEKPFAGASLYQQAVAAISRADAMGLLPDAETIESLTRRTMARVLNHIMKAGIGRGLYKDLADPSGCDVPRLEKLLAQVNDALEESPAPAYEWPRLVQVLGVDRLSGLLGISLSSVRRYKERARETPDDVAARLHFVALVVGDLAGAYNDIGIRRWFERPRALLDDRAPADLLTAEWSPGEPGPRKIRKLARALVAGPAT